MGVDKIGPYGLTEEEVFQQRLLAAGCKSPTNNPQRESMWLAGYMTAWKIIDDRLAELCKERP